jgi:Spy/CpxP family protein refolding chaperone
VSMAAAPQDPVTRAKAAADSLNLTEDQKARVDEIMSDYFDQQKADRPGAYRRELQQVLTPQQMEQFDREYEKLAPENLGTEPRQMRSRSPQGMMEGESKTDVEGDETYSK